MRICICDDNSEQRDYLKQLVYKWDSGVTPVLYPSAEALTFDLQGGKSFDIMLLDIEMPGKSGIELAREIRKTDRDVQIIFVTGHPDFVMDGYEVWALHYLMKPVNELTFFSVLGRAAENLNLAEPCIVAEVRGVNHRIRARDIFYAEALSHFITIHTADKAFQTRQLISQFEGVFTRGFLRCHRSYIVNLRHAVSLDKTDIHLENGVLVPLSRRLYTAANRAFIDYYKGGSRDEKAY